MVVLNKKIYDLKIPILGICYGMQLICEQLKGKVIETKKREFGNAKLKILKNDKLFGKSLKKGDNSKVWMSHGDKVVKIPHNFSIIAKTSDVDIAAISNTNKNIYGLQFHPEVIHTVKGKDILKNFILNLWKKK